jgi:hypothetical protein
MCGAVSGCGRSAKFSMALGLRVVCRGVYANGGKCRQKEQGFFRAVA